MVKNILTIEETPQFYDATDALAIALCHAYRRNSVQGKASSWKEFIAKNPSRVKRS
jgi:crossover junction endodeoxyribonuclease RuvC